MQTDCTENCRARSPHGFAPKRLSNDGWQPFGLPALQSIRATCGQQKLPFQFRIVLWNE